MPEPPPSAEEQRLAEHERGARDWRRWGAYLPERQWGTVREDYSPDGDAWGSFTHDQARSRAYRWGEDGLLGLTDRHGLLCFALALWNGKDPILKERLFGLGGPEGNHGQDAKEAWFYLDATPTHSYLRALYKYPLTEYPYLRLVEENRRRGPDQPEFELADTGVFERDYADVTVEYAKAGPHDVLVRVTVDHRGTGPATLDVLPTLWFRNTWSWGRAGGGHGPRPRLVREGAGVVRADHHALPRMRLFAGVGPDGLTPEMLFTENDSNLERLWGAENPGPYVKDAFHQYVVHGRAGAVDPRGVGTKTAARYRLALRAGGRAVLRLRLCAADDVPTGPVSPGPFDALFARRQAEADAFWAARLPTGADAEERRVMRQAYAGLLWTRQFYHYVVRDWLEGDPAPPPPPASRREGRNRSWPHLWNDDVVLVPDKWEYPWYAAWDLAFHAVPLSAVDPELAKGQLRLLLREWYMHPSGQLPACEWRLSDVNPPMHAWACWRVYKVSGPRGGRDRAFLARVFQKLLLDFTWWANRKDVDGRNLFSGGFLGLDNVGPLDRSRPLPGGGTLEQADGTAWMAFYCATMLAMALELAVGDPAYEDMATKFLEHFVAIADAANGLAGHGLWDEQDGFYYDALRTGEEELPLRVRSLAGLVPLLAVEVLEDATLEGLPAFARRLRWLEENRPDLAARLSWLERPGPRGRHGHRLLALPCRDRLVRVLRRVLDPEEFLSPHGVRSLSRHHRDHPCLLRLAGRTFRVDYEPGEGRTRLFGGGSGWRGPVWLPLNHLLVEALERYHRFYGDGLQVECPTGSGQMMDLGQVARELAGRVASLFLPDARGRRPCHGDDPRFAADPHWKDLVLFHECFHGEDGRGLGASHQTGWTALAVRFLEERVRDRAGREA